MLQFPQELVDKVVDYSADLDLSINGESTAICGLVCKAWLPRSRYHLFYTVNITAKSLGSFVDLIDKSSVPLLSYIRHLRLYYLGNPLDASHLGCLHPCPSLESIRVEVDGEGPTPESAESFDNLQIHLQCWSANSLLLSRFELSLFDVKSFPLRTVTQFISCLPSVQELGILFFLSQDGFSEDDSDTDELPLFVPTRLTHLNIRAYKGSNLFFSWLLSLPTLPRVKSLEFTVHEDTEQLAAYIQRAGRELESLTSHMEGPWSDTLSFYQRIYPCTPKLQSLSFKCPNPSDILQILPLVPANLNSLHIIMQFPSTDNSLWRRIDYALAEPRFRNLQRFSMGFTDFSSPYNSLPERKALFPLADARGIIV
ncbi:hypothetical protein B0H11DRAFT_2289488 [Mycena galericulata]|nr:hypothetical protein B0H11DRAFT_2289488 [Mycena galericulata]